MTSVLREAHRCGPRFHPRGSGLSPHRHLFSLSCVLFKALSTSHLFTCLIIMHEIHVRKKLRNTGKYEEERNITHNPATRSCPGVQPCLLSALPCMCSCMPWWHEFTYISGRNPTLARAHTVPTAIIMHIFLPGSKCTSDVLFTGCVILVVRRDPNLISKSPVGVEII